MFGAENNQSPVPRGEIKRRRCETLVSRKCRVLQRFDDSRFFHLRRLISRVGPGNWRFSAPNMSFLLQPWHILLAALCGMVNQRQQQIIEFQNAQIETLLKKLRKKRLLLDDNQRRLLAVKAHAIGRNPSELSEMWTRLASALDQVQVQCHETSARWPLWNRRCDIRRS